jgi:hypothetical protein
LLLAGLPVLNGLSPVPLNELVVDGAVRVMIGILMLPNVFDRLCLVDAVVYIDGDGGVELYLNGPTRGTNGSGSAKGFSEGSAKGS